MGARGRALWQRITNSFNFLQVKKYLFPSSLAFIFELKMPSSELSTFDDSYITSLKEYHTEDTVNIDLIL
jgi:hypothetical protein